MASDLPADFEKFWQETTNEAVSASLDYARNSGNAFDWPGFRVETYSFRGTDGSTKYGWIAVPDCSESLPAFLWVPPYGRESLLPNEYGTRKGFVSCSLNFFGHEAFHTEKYTPGRGYFAEGVLDPHTWVMRSMVQDAILALRVLREQPEVDGERISVMGMSQGGGISIWIGTWLPWIRAICADMPFLSGVSMTLGAHIYRYPLKELVDLAQSAPGGLDVIKSTLAYFDTANLARLCQKPTQVSLGERDPAVKPASVQVLYDALPGVKALRRYPVGHDWYPEMIENNRDWLLRNS